jgi:hypothetical protein
MHSRFFVLTMASVCLFVVSIDAMAQVDEHKFEVGGVFTSITLTDFKSRSLPGVATGDATVTGIGGRLAYNINDNFAIDGEASIFPESHLGNDEFAQKAQGFVGIKAGIRNKWLGVFAKARPGVMWFGEFSSVGGCSATNFGRSCGVSHEKDFAMDLGGVVEVYPAERAIIRVDLGDTIIRYPERNLGVFNPVVLNSEVKNNFQVSVGFGWRF